MRQLTFLVVLFLSINFCLGQGLPGGGGGKAERNEKDVSFAPIPFIDYNRAIGFSVGFVPMVMYNLSKEDTISPSSISGLMGMYSSNGTWFGMGFNKFYIKEDKYRISAAGGFGYVNYQFLLNEIGFIDYNIDMSFAMIEVQRQIIPNLYFGLNYMYANMNTQYDIDIPENTTNLELNGIGTVLSYDGRDSVYYPHSGFIANVNFKSFPNWMNDQESNKLEFDVNKFISMKNGHDVIGLRAMVGIGIGELDFNQQFIVGSTDIRGYSLGEFRGDQVVALQGEYRMNPFKKIGFVGFAGVAMTFNGINESNNGKLLPGIGTGFRYNVFPKNHMNVGMDFGVGVNDWSLEFKIGESF